MKNTRKCVLNFEYQRKFDNDNINMIH